MRLACKYLTSVGLVASLILAGAPALAHPGHDHKVMGTITMVDAEHVMVKTNDGRELTVSLTKTTKLLKGKKKGDAAELKTGMRVIVNVGNGEEPLSAKELQYSAETATKSSR